MQKGKIAAVAWRTDGREGRPGGHIWDGKSREGGAR